VKLDNKISNNFHQLDSKADPIRLSSCE